jgi:hypothetical protein
MPSLNTTVTTALPAAFGIKLKFPFASIADWTANRLLLSLVTVRGRFYKPKKIPTTMKLDDDILLFFKKTEYNIIINNLLREYMQINIDKVSPTNKI